MSDSFQNWEGMRSSGGRRVKRSINIDMTSIRFCTPEMLERYKRIDLLKDYIARTQQRSRSITGNTTSPPVKTKSTDCTKPTSESSETT